MRKWRIEDSAELYNINGWGRNYFSINEKGHVQVTPKEGLAAVDLKEVMDELQVRDVQAPVLLRFPDILDNRVEKISSCFKQGFLPRLRRMKHPKRLIGYAMNIIVSSETLR